MKNLHGMALRSVGSALLALGLASSASAQSWDQHLLSEFTDSQLPRGIALADGVIAFGQPRLNPYGQAHIEDLVRVFELQGPDFVEVAELRSTDVNPPTASFGTALAIEGDLLAVGDPDALSSPNFNQTGAVHLYRRGLGGWQLETVLRPSNVLPTEFVFQFGASLDLLNGRLAIGAPGSTGPNFAIEEGRVYIFEEVAGSWTETQMIHHPQPTSGGSFGVDLDLDGNRMLVGGDSAFLFERVGSNFQHVDTLAPSLPVVNEGFGRSLALSGTKAAVSAPGFELNHFADGRVIVFEELAGSWSETQVLTNLASRPYDRFGGDLEFESGSLFVSSDSTASVQRFDQGVGGWSLAERYITSAGFIWSPTIPIRLRALDGQVVVSDSQGVTLFPREVVAEYEIDCEGDPIIGNDGLPLYPISLDQRGEIRLSQATLPFYVGIGSAAGPGLLFYGFSQNNLPLGTGTLCVGPPVVRAAIGGPTGSWGHAVTLDLQSSPVSSGPNSISAGSTTYFQYWFRMLGGTSHLTNSIRMVFAP